MTITVMDKSREVKAPYRSFIYKDGEIKLTCVQFDLAPEDESMIPDDQPEGDFSGSGGGDR